MCMKLKCLQTSYLNIAISHGFLSSNILVDKKVKHTKVADLVIESHSRVILFYNIFFRS